MHTEVIAEIYRGEGELLKQSNPQLDPVLDKYKNVLRKAGREIVELSRLSDDTMAALAKPLVPYNEYASVANEFFDKVQDRFAN